MTIECIFFKDSRRVDYVHSCKLASFCFLLAQLGWGFSGSVGFLCYISLF